MTLTLADQIDVSRGDVLADPARRLRRRRSMRISSGSPPELFPGRSYIGRVCAIFEKLNSTGVELSVYDLLTARLYPHRINLHHLWDEACKKHSRLAKWSDGKAENHKFGVMVLRIMGLLRGLEVGPSNLIKLVLIRRTSRRTGGAEPWRWSVLYSLVTL